MCAVFCVFNNKYLRVKMSDEGCEKAKHENLLKVN